MIDPCAHPQHMKVFKHLSYVGRGCGIPSIFGEPQPLHTGILCSPGVMQDFIGLPTSGRTHVVVVT